MKRQVSLKKWPYVSYPTLDHVYYVFLVKEEKCKIIIQLCIPAVILLWRRIFQKHIKDFSREMRAN